MKQPQAKAGHLAAGGGLTLTQRKVTGQALSDASRKSRAAEALAKAPKPVLGWGAK